MAVSRKRFRRGTAASDARDHQENSIFLERLRTYETADSILLKLPLPKYARMMTSRSVDQPVGAALLGSLMHPLRPTAFNEMGMAISPIPDEGYSHEDYPPPSVEALRRFIPTPCHSNGDTRGQHRAYRPPTVSTTTTPAARGRVKGKPRGRGRGRGRSTTRTQMRGDTMQGPRSGYNVVVGSQLSNTLSDEGHQRGSNEANLSSIPASGSLSSQNPINNTEDPSAKYANRTGKRPLEHPSGPDSNQDRGITTPSTTPMMGSYLETEQPPQGIKKRRGRPAKGKPPATIQNSGNPPSTIDAVEPIVSRPKRGRPRKRGPPSPDSWVP